MRNHVNRFGRITLAPLKDYPIPRELETIEQESSKEAKDRWFDIFVKFGRNRNDAEKYFESYSTMIYLEEAQQSQFLAQFKVTNIKLEWAENNQYRFKNSVIIKQISCDFLSIKKFCFTFQ